MRRRDLLRAAGASLAALAALAAKGLARGRIEHSWMAIRDMGVAAEIIGIRSLRTKLLAFALSSFYCGIAGAMWAFIYTSAVEASAFEIDRSVPILFVIIIGSLGSILSSFLGAAFMCCCRSFSTRRRASPGSRFRSIS
jgi:branched-chain amino acid transport system permease protein